jgi:hypothetical protein
MLPLFTEGIALEITPVLFLPSIGNESFSTLICWWCLVLPLYSPRSNPLYLVIARDEQSCNPGPQAPAHLIWDEIS